MADELRPAVRGRGGRKVRRTSPRTRVPRNAVLVAAAVAAVLALINAGDPVAFSGVISISVAGLLGSYLAAASLLLWRRLQPGAIRAPPPPPPSSSSSSTYPPEAGAGDVVVTNTVGAGAHLAWGPWRIPGWLGVANNALTCCFVTFVLFFSFWPTSREVTPQNMNWAALVTVVVLAFSVLYYYVWARKVFKGPVIEV